MPERALFYLQTERQQKNSVRWTELKYLIPSDPWIIQLISLVTILGLQNKILIYWFSTKLTYSRVGGGLGLGVEKSGFDLSMHCIFYYRRTSWPADLLTSSPVMLSGRIRPPEPSQLCRATGVSLWVSRSWTVVNGNCCHLGGRSAVLPRGDPEMGPLLTVWNFYTNILGPRMRIVWLSWFIPARVCGPISSLGKKTIVSPTSSL